MSETLCLGGSRWEQVSPTLHLRHTLVLCWIVIVLVHTDGETISVHKSFEGCTRSRLGCQSVGDNR